jgi:ABC-type glutathione transport system ATPase component
MADASDTAPILEMRNVSKIFKRRHGETFYAVKNVSLSIMPGETVALVGESGSGKTSLSRIALALLKPDEGDVILDGCSLVGVPFKQLQTMRIAMQPVFQDSGAAFNPRRTVSQLMTQALSVRDKTRRDFVPQIVELLEQVSLRPGKDYLNRFPHELSGGQRQRLAIAKAIAVDPKLIIADEPLSGADVSIRGQLLNLLVDLQNDRNVAYLFVTHDISVARAFAHRILVMFKGSVVEEGLAESVVDHPTHPYTQRLVAAALRPVHARSRA